MAFHFKSQVSLLQSSTFPLLRFSSKQTVDPQKQIAMSGNEISHEQ